MTRNTKTSLITALCYLVFLAVIFGVARLLHLEDTRFWIFFGVLALAGLIAAIAIVIYRRKSIDPNTPDAAAADTTNLDVLVRSAEIRLKTSRSGVKSLGSMPLVYLLGDENSAKTQTVLQSGLDAELIAGEIQRDGQIAPTPLANIWFTGTAAVVEAGGALLRQPGLWQRLIRLTQPSKLRGALTKGALQPTRAAILCISVERLTQAGTPEALRALGQVFAERLRTLSQTLGISLPVYVLFTKLDTIPSFADYAVNLTDDEVRDPLGSLLAQSDVAVGLYAERATAQAAERFDELCYSLSEFRMEVLSRGGQPENLARAYEFPRELRKLRSSVVDLLVEIGRPSQLGVNPFLRGFFFSGMRARIVEDAPAQPAYAAPVADAGATRVFSFNTPAAQPMQAPAPQRASRRVPQWVFLPRLFPSVVLADRAALDTSRASTKVNVVKRILIATAAACFLAYLIGLTVSYLNNAALERRLRNAAAAPTFDATPDNPASLSSLQSLEQLRLVFLEIAGYHKDGAPLSYRWGLYDDPRLYRTACSAYASHFRPLLLAPTQTAMLARFTALPAAPVPTDEYIATYRPLRAYLITTSNPEKSTTDFLPGVMQDAWAGTRTVPPAEAELAQSQFQTYAATLPEPGSCMAALNGPPQPPAVNQARVYLSHFQGLDQVYASMRAAANRKFKSIRFNETFPGSIRYVVDPYEVEGAFTKAGYAFMQNAMLHPEPYTSGEEWVLGAQTGTGIDPNVLHAQLPVRYQADFLNAWRTYLKTAHVVSAANLAEAKEHLHQLDGASSSLLQLFQLISENTALPNPAFREPFQAPQSVVPPDAKALPVSSPYMQGLSALENSLSTMLNNPGSETDPAATAPVIAAASAAEGAVNTVRGGFNPPDPTGGMDTTSEHLLLAPITTVQALAKGDIKKKADPGSGTLCASFSPVLSKFPFNPDAKVDAIPADVAKTFAPGSGAIAQWVTANNKIVMLQGSTYVQTPGAPITVNPAFLRFLNTAQAVSAAFFPAAGGDPQVSFSLTQEATPNLSPATLDVDGTTLASAGLTKQFTWKSSPSSNIRFNFNGGTAPPATGPWALFHFAYGVRHPAPNKLEYVVVINGQNATNSANVPLDYKFDVGGPGAPLLNPSYMRNLRCVAKVSQ